MSDEEFVTEGRVTHLSRKPARVKFDEKPEIDTFVTILEVLDLTHSFLGRNKIVKAAYPDPTSIRPGDYISARGQRTQNDGFNYRGFAEEIFVLHRGLFRNKRLVDQDYRCPHYLVESLHW